MMKLCEMGLGTAIDNLGTGYSSLAYLHTLPFTCLKIDRTFITRLSKEDSGSSVVATIISITKSLKAYVVAERVENAMQLNYLAHWPVIKFKGFITAVLCR
jgi:EAL domain-containing protein (putative c-di-GMP-specific phosphodiesterase class I)